MITTRWLDIKNVENILNVYKNVYIMCYFKIIILTLGGGGCPSVPLH